jgi:hypothetical protein
MRPVADLLQSLQERTVQAKARLEAVATDEPVNDKGVDAGVPLFLLRFRTFQKPLFMRVSRGQPLATRMNA